MLTNHRNLVFSPLIILFSPRFFGPLGNCIVSAIVLLRIRVIFVASLHPRWNSDLIARFKTFTLVTLSFSHRLLNCIEETRFHQNVTIVTCVHFLIE